MVQDIRDHMSSSEPAIHPGDHIHVWSFNGDVLERLEIDFRPGEESAILKEIAAKLKKAKTEGRRTSLARPIIRALERFLSADYGVLNVFIYTDGRDQLGQRDIEHILRLYNHSFKIEQRLRNVFLVLFGTGELPKESRDLVETLGGRVIGSSAKLELSIAKKEVVSVAEPAPPPPASEPSNPAPPVRVSPASVVLKLAPGTEPSVHAVPIQFEFESTPSAPLSISLGLEIPGLPDGMAVTLLADRLATEGRQSLVFSIRNGQPGVFNGKILLKGPIEIQPAELPVQIEVGKRPLEKVHIEFYPTQLALLSLASGSNWHRINDLGMVQVFPESLSEVQAQFRWEAPPGVELRILPGGSQTNAIAVDQPVSLGVIGRLAVFEIRHPSGELPAGAQSGKLSLEIPGFEPSRIDGVRTVVVPFEFVPSFEVRIENRDLPLGEVRPDVKSLTRSITVQAKGDLTGRKLRVLPQEPILNLLKVQPREVELKAGTVAVDLEFSGFEGHPAGPIQGTVLIVPDGLVTTNLAPYTVAIRGTVLQPSKLIPSIKNPMVTDQPIRILAELQPPEKGASIFARVETPNGKEPIEMELVDDGSPDHGDQKEGDGIYSGLFKETREMGAYRIVIGAKKPEVQSESLTARIYFSGPQGVLAGRIVNRKHGGQGEFLELACSVESDYPGDLAVTAEPVGMHAGLNTFVATKTLKRGMNKVQFAVGLNQDSRAGSFDYRVNLVTDAVESEVVRIPIHIEVRVLSFFQYFTRLSALTLAVAFAVLLAFFGPWRKTHARHSARSSVTQAMRSDQEPIDYR